MQHRTSKEQGAKARESEPRTALVALALTQDLIRPHLPVSDL
jgi:hypothetical protein